MPKAPRFLPNLCSQVPFAICSAFCPPRNRDEANFTSDQKSFRLSSAQKIVSLVQAVANSSGIFKIHVPKEVSDDPSVLESDEIIARLIDTKWWIVCGEEETLLEFVELLMFAQNLTALEQELERQLEEEVATDIELPICGEPSVATVFRSSVAKQLMASLKSWM